MGQPKVAFVRGAALNPFETQVFSGLTGYDVQALGRDPATYEVDLVPAPVQLLPTVAGDGRLGRAGRRMHLPLGRWLGAPGHLRGLAEAVEGADVIHAAETFIPLSEQCADIARLNGAKLVLTCWENIPFRDDEIDVIAARKRKLRDAASLFIAVTEPARDALVAEGVSRERIRVIPAAIDVSRFGHTPRDRFLASKLGLPAAARIVLFIGRIIREKGVTELVQAFARAVSGDTETHLVIVGNGPQVPRVERAVDALQVRDRVHLLPGQSYRDVPAVFGSADVVVIPSLSTPYWQEQFGYVLVEAMASGRPIITTRSGSIPHVVGNAAVIVDDYDVSALACAIREILDNDEHAMTLGSAGRLRAEQQYAADVVAPQLAEAYTTALSR